MDYNVVVDGKVIITISEQQLQNLKTKKRIPKKRITIKKKDYASCPTSLISQELTKSCKPEKIKEEENNNTIISKEIENKAGIINFAQIIDDEITSFTQQSEILNNYKTLKFTREELQIYLAILNIYMQNTNKKNYGKELIIEVPSFHNKILKRKNRLRKEDLQKYENIFQKLAQKRIIYDSYNASVKPYSKKEFKTVHINSSLINIDIMSYSGYKTQVIRIIPSAYTLLELQSIKQISNFLPWELVELGFDESDNIFYFGLFLVRMHRINETHIVDKKRIKNITYAWEIEFQTFIEEALPNGNELIKKYNSLEDHKKRFILNNLEIPLGKALKFFENRNYILPQKNKRLNINYKNPFDNENKIKMIFNYDNGKLLKL